MYSTACKPLGLVAPVLGKLAGTTAVGWFTKARPRRPGHAASFTPDVAPGVASPQPSPISPPPILSQLIMYYTN